MNQRAGLVGIIAVAGAIGLAAPIPSRAEESWDAIYMGSVKVGYNRIRVNPVKDADGRDLLHVQVNQVLHFRRGRDRVDMEMRFGTIENLQGSVLSMDVRIKTGAEEMRTFGEASNGMMPLTFEIGRQRQYKSIPWSEEVRGPYAAEQSLARQPIQPGEVRELKTFVPILNVVGTIRLKAVEKERMALGGGVVLDLLRVEQTGLGPDGKPLSEFEATHWVDDRGQVLYGRSPAFGGIQFYRVSAAAAQAPNGDFDLLAATILKPSGSFANPTRTQTATYRLSLVRGDLAELFPSDQRQTLTLSGPTSGTLVVRADSPTAGAADPAPVGPEYLEPNPLVNSDDPRIIQNARSAVGRLSDPWAKAVAIQEWVWRNLRKKDYGTVFASATEVARTLEGDCTEHGVLTAAMCRAVGVPCRVVVGLLYAPAQGGFGGHMWNEVHVNGRWVALDATLNQSVVDATHLKLAVSSLEGVAPFEVMTPVMRLYSETLKIEIVSAR